MIPDPYVRVNGLTYGVLMRGASIVVDHGKVLVDGKELEGRQMSQDDVRRAAPAEETTGEVAGYPVTVRPGALSSSAFSAFGSHSFKAGTTTVVVNGNSLQVNAKTYGTLKEGDTIVVEFGRVMVSGKERAESE